MAKYIFRLFILLSAFLYTKCVNAQVTALSNTNALHLAQKLAGTGVTVSNAVLTGSYFNGTAGTFSAVNSNLGISSGVVLSTGFVSSAPGHSMNASTDFTCMGCSDNSLLQLAQQGNQGITSMLDAVTLEFDILVTSDTLKFNYVFASEEYPVWVCSGFNDVFGFFISGPGISGPFPGNSKNIALIPGTTLPVSINTVNSGGTPCPSNSQYYFDNLPTVTNNTVVFNGFTTVLTAVVAVQPCQTYRLRLSIADGGDQAQDSGVFIEEGSLVSAGITVEAATTAGTAFPEMIEGCNAGIFTFTRPVVDNYPQNISIAIGGTAQNGIDYPLIQNTVTIPANQASTTIQVMPVIDNIKEVQESIIIYILGGCVNNIMDSAVLYINDYVPPAASGDTVVCEGQPVQLWAEGGSIYTWSPATFLNDPFIAEPTATPTTDIGYIVKIANAQCIYFDTVNIIVMPAPVITVSDDTLICAGGTALLDATGGLTYAWTPATGLSDAAAASPVATPAATTTYTVSVTNGCIATDSVKVEVQVIDIDITADTIICENTAATLSATGGISYSWSPAEGLNDTNLAAPVAAPAYTTIYTVTVTDQMGCEATADVEVYISVPPVVGLGKDTVICYGEIYQLDAGAEASSYRWQGGSPSRYYDVYQPGNYIVQVTNYDGCSATDSVMITMRYCDDMVKVPNAFTPNKDGLNDLFMAHFYNADLSYFQVYNRWGQMVFETHSENISWDGTFNGSECPMGAYLWVIEYADERGEKKLKKGNVTLLR